MIIVSDSNESNVKILRVRYYTVGTNNPLDIRSCSDAPLSLPLATSARNKSPLLR